MATHKSAIKATRQAIRRRQRNRHHRTGLRTQLKKLRAAIASGNPEEANALLRPTVALLDHTVSLGILHRNTASRTKSRLSRHVQRLAAGS